MAEGVAIRSKSLDAACRPIQGRDSESARPAQGTAGNIPQRPQQKKAIPFKQKPQT